MKLTLTTFLLLSTSLLCADTAVVKNAESLFLYEKPLRGTTKTKINKQNGDFIKIGECSKYGWCKSGNGYVKKMFLTKITKDKKPIAKKVKQKKTEKKQKAIKKVLAVKNIKSKNAHNKNDFFTINYKKKYFDIKNTNNQIDLTIKKLIKEIIKRNPNILFEKLQSDVAKQQVEYEDNLFVPHFYINYTHSSNNSPNSVETQSSRGYLNSYEETVNNGELGFTGLLPTGARWNASIKSNDKESNLISHYDKGYDTEYDESLEISLTQPLLRGFGEDTTNIKYDLAKAEFLIQKKQYQKRVMDVMGSAIQAYWKYYSNSKIYEYVKESLIVASKLVNILEQRAANDDLAYSEVLEAKSALLVREAEVKQIQSEVIKSKNEILTMLNVSMKDNEGIQFNPLEKPDFKNDEYLSMKKYYQLAIENWPELAIVREKQKKENLQINNAKNNAKPKFDLVLTGSSQSLNDKRKNEFYDEEYLSWSVGFQYSMPLINDQALSAIRVAKLKKQQIDLEYRTLNTGLYNALSTKYETLLNSKEQVNSYAVGLKMKEELYKYGKKSFNIGDKSIRYVLSQEKDIIEYQRKLFGSILEWKLAELSLNKAVGSILNKYKISIHDNQNLVLDKKLTDKTFGK